MFEFTSDALGAQSGVGGGGRYDRLVERLGGPPTPGAGWAAGVERILLASQAPAAVERPLVFVALERAEHRRAGLRLVRDLRARGVAAEMEQAGRSLKGQLKHAARAGAERVVIVGAGELHVRDMRTRDERSAADPGEALAMLVGDEPR